MLLLLLLLLLTGACRRSANGASARHGAAASTLSTPLPLALKLYPDVKLTFLHAVTAAAAAADGCTLVTS
jgi:hypothetical protein